MSPLKYAAQGDFPILAKDEVNKVFRGFESLFNFHKMILEELKGTVADFENR